MEKKEKKEQYSNWSTDEIYKPGLQPILTTFLYLALCATSYIIPKGDLYTEIFPHIPL